MRFLLRSRPTGSIQISALLSTFSSSSSSSGFLRFGFFLFASSFLACASLIFSRITSEWDTGVSWWRHIGGLTLPVDELTQQARTLVPVELEYSPSLLLYLGDGVLADAGLLVLVRSTQAAQEHAVGRLVAAAPPRLLVRCPRAVPDGKF